MHGKKPLYTPTKKSKYGGRMKGKEPSMSHEERESRLAERLSKMSNAEKELLTKMIKARRHRLVEDVRDRKEKYASPSEVTVLRNIMNAMPEQLYKIIKESLNNKTVYSKDKMIFLERLHDTDGKGVAKFLRYVKGVDLEVFDKLASTIFINAYGYHPGGKENKIFRREVFPVVLEVGMISHFNRVLKNYSRESAQKQVADLIYNLTYMGNVELETVEKLLTTFHKGRYIGSDFKLKIYQKACEQKVRSLLGVEVIGDKMANMNVVNESIIKLLDQQLISLDKLVHYSKHVLDVSKKRSGEEIRHLFMDLKHSGRINADELNPILKYLDLEPNIVDTETI